MSEIREWTTTQRWLYAIKPASWPKLLVPMALGQALGIAVSGQISMLALLLGVLFTLCDGLFIVLLNDWGDERVDRIKRDLFPQGCSPKTIPDGVLPAHHLLVAGLVAGLGALMIGAIATTALGLTYGLLGAGCCLGLFVAYSLPPFELNYRGGGELLEMLGVGVALPLFNAYLQSGTLWDPRYELLAGYALLSMGSALASGLADEVSDHQGGKRTFTTMFGNRRVRTAVEVCLGLGGLAWWLARWRHGSVIPWIAVAGANAAVVYYQWQLLEMTHRAKTNAWDALKLYKLHLHRGIWYAGLVMTTGLLLHALWLAGGAL